MFSGELSWSTDSIHLQISNPDIKDQTVEQFKELQRLMQSQNIQGPWTLNIPCSTWSVFPTAARYPLEPLQNGCSNNDRWWFTYLYWVGRRGFFMSASYRLIMWSMLVKISVKFNWNFEFKISINTGCFQIHSQSAYADLSAPVKGIWTLCFKESTRMNKYNLSYMMHIWCTLTEP